MKWPKRGIEGSTEGSCCKYGRLVSLSQSADPIIYIGSNT